MKREIINNRSWRVLLSIMFTMVLILGVFSPVFANDMDVPADPGVGTGQDKSKVKSTKWVYPHGSEEFIGTLSIDFEEEFDNLEISSNFSPGNSDVEFLGITGLYEYSDDAYYTNTVCGEGSGLTGCYFDAEVNGSGNGNGGGPFKPVDDSCGGVWITPGQVVANAWQIAPENSVVIGQDPQENGATLEWHVSIYPTTVAYTMWQIIAHRIVACVENGPNGVPHLEEGVVEECPHGWHSVIQHIWGCAAKEKTYTEGIADLKAKATLQLDSRLWIQTELAAAYPGAHLINPDWAFSTTPVCTWVGDVCNWDFTLTVPAADPGWYDLKVEGMTAGTAVTPPRSFGVLAGVFGTYLIDSSTVP